MLPTIGKKAPSFKAKDEHGNPIQLKDFLGKKVALYCYPNDSTATCTVQACNLRDHFDQLKKHGIVIIGLSPNDALSHQKFINRNQLPFPLIVDQDQTILKKYGVWGLKKFMGREFLGVHRTTFLINEEGVLEHIITKVKSKEHAQQILETWGL